VFALALPATHLFAARQVGERIAAVIGCTAFEAGSGKTPFVVEFDIGAAQLMDGETVSEALTRAAEEINRPNREAV
jgi:two-component system, cell cycle response regulator PopA